MELQDNTPFRSSHIQESATSILEGHIHCAQRRMLKSLQKLIVWKHIELGDVSAIAWRVDDEGTEVPRFCASNMDS